MQDYEVARAEFAKVLEREGVEVVCEFLPTVWEAGKWECIRWTCTVKKGGRVLLGGQTYSQGIGHLPGYVPNSRMTVDELAEIKRVMLAGGRYKGRPLIIPSGVDVLSSLLSDGGAIDYATFEQYADDLGIDADSRKEEATYRKCLEIGLALRAGLGEAVFKELQELAGRL